MPQLHVFSPAAHTALLLFAGPPLPSCCVEALTLRLRLDLSCLPSASGISRSGKVHHISISCPRQDPIFHQSRSCLGTSESNKLDLRGEVLEIACRQRELVLVTQLKQSPHRLSAWALISYLLPFSFACTGFSSPDGPF